MENPKRARSWKQRIQPRVTLRKAEPVLYSTRSFWCRRFRCADRLELVDSSVRHQRQKEMIILDRVRPHEFPVLGDAIVEGSGRAHRAREGERTELELIRSRRLPRSGPEVAVDSRAHTTIGLEGDRVLRLVVGRQRFFVTALELHELPGRAAEAARCVLRRRLHVRTAGDCQQERRQQR